MDYLGRRWTTEGPDPDDYTTWPGYDPQGMQKWLGQTESAPWNPMEFAGGWLGAVAPIVGGAMALPGMFGGWMGQQGAGQEPSLESLDPAEAQRKLRMYRARQQYEQRFGTTNPAGSSWSVGDPDELLGRVRQARQQFGWRPGQQWGAQ